MIDQDDVQQTTANESGIKYLQATDTVAMSSQETL